MTYPSDGYETIVNLILGVPDEGTLGIPIGRNKEKIIEFIKLLIDTQYFDEYGFIISFSNDYSHIKKLAQINEKSLKRFPQLNTYGKLLYCIKNPEMYNYYDEYNRFKYQRNYEGEYTE